MNRMSAFVLIVLLGASLAWAQSAKPKEVISV
jgi:hypothetical protein